MESVPWFWRALKSGKVWHDWYPERLLSRGVKVKPRLQGTTQDVRQQYQPAFVEESCRPGMERAQERGCVSSGNRVGGVGLPRSSGAPDAQ